MPTVAFENTTEQKIIAWASGELSPGNFEFIGGANYSLKNWHDYYYSFPDFMREFLPVPTHTEPVAPE